MQSNLNDLGWPREINWLFHVSKEYHRNTYTALTIPLRSPCALVELDFHDAEDRVTMLKDWIKGEPDEDQYEIPDVEKCIPACIKERVLSRRKLREVRAQLGPRRAGLLIDAVLDLVRISGQAKRPELTEQMREELGDTNPPLPSLLAVFGRGRRRGRFL